MFELISSSIVLDVYSGLGHQGHSSQGYEYEIGIYCSLRCSRDVLESLINRCIHSASSMSSHGLDLFDLEQYPHQDRGYSTSS